MANKISCSSKKTLLIDPNDFDGQNLSNNISVPLEDLSIYVQLETTKKARTILNSNGISSTFISTEGSYVTFIEGDKVAGKKALTTSYTDLTTNLNEPNVQQALGISSIDIDFNSSYAPLIVINFIDLRGSAIFQNEEFIANGQNKYAEFFSLPYPIFTLTVKGYYGMPVKYNLHLTKFNARFNSQTGNFEITANFIGYTYAMLSDMLIGYLRAIPYTEKGKEKWEQIKETRSNLYTLDELAEKISKIDEGVKKLEDSDPNVADLKKLDSKLELITTLKSNINTFGQSDFNINKDATDFKFVLKDNFTTNTQVGPLIFAPLQTEQQTTSPFANPFAQTTNTELNDAIKTYNENIAENVKLFNTEMFSDISLNEKELSFSNVKTYKGLSLRLLNSTNTLTSELSQALDKVKTREELKIYGSQNNIAFEKVFDVYDFREQLRILNETETNLKQEGNNLKIEVANTLRNNITQEIKFEPTIRAIVGSFTAAVELFMHVLYDVATEATTSPIRKSELEKKFINSFDYKSTSVNKTTNNDASSKLNQNFYPWPEYREPDAVNKGAYVEKYLGNSNVLDASKIDETIFIDDLLKAFIESAKKIADIEIASELNNSNWIPINPIDTRLFIDSFPYKRIQANTKEEVIALLMERAFIYIGYTNYKLSKEEIVDIANKESEAILSLIDNDVIKKSLSQLKKEDFVDVKAKNNNESVSLIKKLNNDWYYNFIYDSQTKKILPITTNDNKFEYQFSFLENTKNKAEEGNLFLTNYTSSNYLNPNNTINQKEDDGGVYIKIISPDTYKSSIKSTSVVNESSTLLLDVLKLPQEKFNKQFNEVGFNQYSGPYSIQDYKVLNYGVDKMDKAEYRIMFFSDIKEGGFNYEPFAMGSVCYKRKEKITPYDIGSDKIKQFEKIQDAVKYTIGKQTTHDSLGKNRILLSSFIEEKSDNVSYPFIGFQISAFSDSDSAPIGLFGSRLYNEQIGNIFLKFDGDYAKALLFLHTLPWNGLYSSENDNQPKGIFNVNEILNTFGNRAGFISAPKLWVAFIGGMLWRADSSKPIFHKGTNIIKSGGSGNSDPINWTKGTESLIPTWDVSTVTPKKLQYLKHDSDDNRIYKFGSMVFPQDEDDDFIDLDNTLLQLPDQVKNEFKQVFFDFVKLRDGESDWSILKNKLEVFKPTTATTWVNTYNRLLTNISAGGGLYSDGTLRKEKMFSLFNAENNGKKVLNDYIIFSPYEDNDDFKYNFMTELKDNSDGVNMILELMTQEVYIANTTYRIWQQEKTFCNTCYEKMSNIFVSDDDLNTFISTCTSNFSKQNSQTVDEKKKQQKNEIFGSDSDIVIKFQLYRTCKNIYDKWIGGTDSLINLMFGKNEFRNGLDKELAGVGKEIRLIDSFRFVNRSFRDIGDEFIINPTPIISYLKENQNSSFYDVVGSLLSSNNFDFIALPSFINFNEKNLVKMFTPMTTLEAFDNGEIGPSFVCVYVGQTSKNLNFNASEYPNDGVDFRCDSEGNLETSLAQDFYQEKESHENNVAVFAVNYSQQNQNIFKDIILDQNEFSETAESLKIVDDIATKGSENRRTYGGQNIFNVYSVRSYKAEVEMMGNAMIQPMMYFQLNNIPMFHGAYMITHVKHNIKPNHMSTSFTGVRIKNIETKLMKESEFYMSLLESIGIDGIDETVNTNSVNGKNYIDDYYNDLLLNTPAVKTIENSQLPNKKALTDRALQEISNWKNGSIKEQDGVQFLDVYVKEVPGISSESAANDTTPWSAVFTSYLMLGGDKSFPKSPMHYDYVTNAMKGKNGYEAFSLNSGLKIKAEIGDLMCYKRSGSYTASHCDVIYNVENNKAYIVGGNIANTIQLKQINLDNGYLNQPVSEYKILVKKTNNFYYNSKKLIGTGVDISSNSGTVATGTDADYWSLVAICALENGTDQGRCDVAQSIYNRLDSKLYGSNTIKGLIIAKNQYEPVDRAVQEFNSINNKNTAIKAFMKSKNVSEQVAKNEIEKSVKALKNTTLVNSSKQFIGGRTDFYSNTIKDRIPLNGRVGLVERDNQIFGWFVGPSSIAYGKKNPIASNSPNFSNVA
jgi:hypothetical protein